jgi:TolA-binding protein
MKNLLIAFTFIAIFSSCKSGKEKLEENIVANEQKLFSDSTRMLDAAVAANVLTMYKEFVEKYPDDTITSSYLFKSADLANGLRKYKDAIDLYSQFREKYPDHRRAPAALFLQAFINDNNIHDKEKAKQLYAEFLQKYPTHELAPSAHASLDQINSNLTDEQLIKMFEARNDSLSKK